MKVRSSRRWGDWHATRRWIFSALFAAVSCSLIVGSSTAEPASPCPSDGEPCRILPLGDSLTWGLGYEGGYRVALFQRASAAGKRITFVGSLQNGPPSVGGQPFPRHNQG